jgi:Tol biopolymer transport system component
LITTLRTLTVFALVLLASASFSHAVQIPDDTHPYDLVYVLNSGLVDVPEGRRKDIYALSLADNRPVRLTSSKGDEYNLMVSPDGSQIAYNIDRDGNIDIYVMSLADGETQNVISSPANDFLADWSPDGTRLYFSSIINGVEGIFAATVATGEIMTVIEQAVSGFTLSRDGQYAAYYTSEAIEEPLRSLCILTLATGEERCIQGSMGTALPPTWSPDGSQLLIEIYADATATRIFIINVDGTGFRALSAENAREGGASWSPDGSQIAFHAIDRSSQYLNLDIFVMNADGTNRIKLADSPTLDLFPVWSPDGSQIAFYSARDMNGEIYLMNADGSDQRRLTFTRGGEGEIQWIPTD